jgi:hypothetical protein
MYLVYYSSTLAAADDVSAKKCMSFMSSLVLHKDSEEHLQSRAASAKVPVMDNTIPVKIARV